MLFTFHIRQGDSALITEIDVPSQQLKGLKTKQTTCVKDELTIDAGNLGFRFTGKWNKDSNQAEGTFYEGINSKKLSLIRDAIAEAKPNRPQEPKKPYPYREKEVVFKNLKANITLAGTLTLPELSGKNFPAVILITGSSPQDRNETIAGHNHFGF
ncbi:MAG: hypothetical protein ABIO55_00770 [Ginsengibacter sp.]